MTRCKMFKGLVFAVLGLSFAGGPVFAAGPVGCPAFTAGMIDAALLSLRSQHVVRPITVELAIDDPSGPTARCRLNDTSSPGRFLTLISEPTEGAELFVFDVDTLIIIVEHTTAPGLSTQELHACRSEILRSFTWNRYCVLALP